jgi:hypothetical protein
MPHPRDIVINSMARTLIVTAYADERERADEDDGDTENDADWNARWRELPAAGPGEDWMDVTPEGTADVQRRALIEAAILYGRIAQAWGAEPWLLVHHYDDSDDAYQTWGHYAVMSALGHGVCWEDDHDTLRWPNEGKTYTVGGVAHIENLDVSPGDFEK